MSLAQVEPAGYYAVRSKATGEEIQLAMQRLWLTGQVTPFGARLLVEHTFESGEPQPVEVVYAFMLPQDAALRSFRVTGKGFEVESDLKPVEEAVDIYEKGIDNGSLSVLTRQYLDGMVNLTVGNLQPGETVRVVLEILAGVERHDDGFRFRFPFTVAPAYHPQARAVALPDGGEMELPREEFGDLILPSWRNEASGLHGVGFDLQLLGGQQLSEVRSPSHAVTVAGEGSERRLGLAVDADLPDRDLVLEARVSEPWSLAWHGDGTVSALLGSKRFGEPDEESPRRVVFVLDRSGSMSGRPIEQAKRAIEAGIAALRPQDRFSIVAFDHETAGLRGGLLEATDRNRQRAREFLAGIDARGGTELAAGVTHAARIFKGEGGDLLLLTDGQVFGTGGILETARQAGARVHALGIGSASQDRFLAQLGRETGGQSRFLTPRERVDLALLDLFASASPAVATEVEVGAGGEKLAKSDIQAGRPWLVRQEMATEAAAEIEVVWDGGAFRVPVAEAPGALAETLRLLHGAARITEAESQLATWPEDEALGELAALSREYGLASRAMALVAVVARESDRRGELPTTRVVPVGLPQDLDPGAYFGASVPLGDSVINCLASPSFAAIESEEDSSGFGFAKGDEWSMSEPPMARRLFSRAAAGELPDMADLYGPTEEEQLLDDASRLEADGGMPGETAEERITASLDLLERLVEHGSTRAQGPFRHHVRRLLEFLEGAELDEEQAEQLADLIGRLEA